MQAESTSLLQESTGVTSHRRLPKWRPSCKRFCLPSKAATLILFWSAAVGVVYYDVLITTSSLIYSKMSANISIPSNDFLPYVILALVSIVYPLCGLIADVCLGRLKTVVVSMMLVTAFVMLICLTEILVYATNLKSMLHKQDISAALLRPEGVVMCIMLVVAFVMFVVGQAGYQANVIQLGLDQLFEAPSQYLSLYILYTLWAFHIGSVILTSTLPLLLCANPVGSRTVATFSSMPFLFALFLIILLIISWWKRHWFVHDPGKQNPYKTVFKVLNFARKHKYPLLRSAFTYNNNFSPSRIDFAKEIYGGPFTTEQVENVKTFIRIVVVLLAIGPLLMLEVPGSIFVYPLFGMHAMKHYDRFAALCKPEYAIFVTGSFTNVVSILFLYPAYIWITMVVLIRKAHGMFARLFTGAVLSLLGVTCLLIIDTVGHTLKHGDHSNQTQCMFQLYRTNHSRIVYPALDLHWSVLIPPSLLLGIGPLLLRSTALEFVSAQSPQPMKGFLIGIYFAIQGLFQFLNSILTIPFSLKHLWASRRMLEDPPVTNCGFVYFLFTIVVGLVGLALFLLAAKRYKYRERDEGMFRQQDVEEIYERYITQETSEDSDNYDNSDTN